MRLSDILFTFLKHKMECDTRIDLYKIFLTNENSSRHIYVRCVSLREQISTIVKNILLWYIQAYCSLNAFIVFGIVL